MSDDGALAALEAMADDELWSEFVKGDDAAIRVLERRYRDELYWYVLLSTGKEDRTAVHLRDAWARLAAYRKPYDGFDSFRGWLYAVVTQNAVPAAHPELFGLADLVDELKRPELKDRRARLFFHIVDMTRAERQPFLLVTLAGLSVEQAAQACNFTPRRVRDALAMAFRGLSGSDLFRGEGAGGV